MTIKQQGGIFGRNPTFNNVTVDGVLTVDQIVEKTGASGITLDGVTLKDGNVVLADGNGIDFSTTAGTGTSELFDDYEEGTWTPTYTTDGTDFDSVNYDSRTHGRYVKIGSLVYVSCLVQTDGITVGSASGDVLIGGLPFTASNDPSNAEGNTGAISSFAFAGDHPSVGFAVRNSTTIKLQYRATANGAVSDLQIADLNTGANDNFLQLALSYRAQETTQWP